MVTSAMASIPPQRQRRASPTHPTSSNEESYASIQRENSLDASTTSVDSQTVFPNQPNLNLSTSAEDVNRNVSTVASTSQAQIDDTTQEPQKCWICFSDETEDSQDPKPVWCAPCPCALTAHEACLLDWIADLESPTANRSTASPKEIKCPQCKSEIKLARPRSYVVEAVSAIEKLANKALLPAIAGGLGYTIVLGCAAHGAHSIRVIFGQSDAEELLAPLERWQWSWLEHQAQRYLPMVAGPFFRDWRGLRVQLGLPLIPIVLVVSRTSLADAVLPVLPIVFFATNSQSNRTLRLGYWPPSSALVFTLLPYLRSAYDEYMSRVWAARERRWVEEVRPQLGGEQNQMGGENEVNAARDAANGIQVGIEVEVVDDEDADDDEGNVEDDNGINLPPNPIAPDINAPAHDDPAGPAANRNEGGEINIAEELAAAARQQRQQGNQNEQPIRARDTDLLPYVTRAADSILGALLFPSLASLSGEILKLFLPKSWTVAPNLSFASYGTNHRFSRRLAPTGLLQTKWGRSVVGGCLLVVLKDAIRIYCRYRIALSHRQRHVLNFDGSKGRRNVKHGQERTDTTNTTNTNLQAPDNAARENQAQREGQGEGEGRRPLGSAFSLIMRNA